jgi:CBS domain-containing protein
MGLIKSSSTGRRPATCASLLLPVAEVMTRNVSTCDVNDSISSVMDRMTKGKFRHMPVLDTHCLAGMISIGDALKWQIEMSRESMHQSIYC